jgi:hypothetical protein
VPSFSLKFQQIDTFSILVLKKIKNSVQKLQKCPNLKELEFMVIDTFRIYKKFPSFSIQKSVFRQYEQIIAIKKVKIL